jgi:cytochrome P450
MQAQARRFVRRTLPLLDELYFLRRFIANYADGDVELFKKYGDVVRVRVPLPYLCLFHPRHVKHVLKTNVLNYPKGKVYDTLKPILGEGIFVAEGEEWTRQRRMLQPEFRESVVARFLPVMVDCTRELFDEWQRHGATTPRNVSDDMMNLTLWIIGGSIFNNKLRKEAVEVGHGLAVVLEQAAMRALTGGLLAEWLPTPGNRRAKAAAERIDAVVREIIRRGRQNDGTAGDLLSRIIRARDEETNSVMTDQLILDQVKSLILAGHETTSLTLSWAFYLLAQHPEIEQRLYEEVHRVIGDGAPTVTQVGELHYARMVFLETMRLYPPVPAVPRAVLQEEELDGFRIRTDETVLIAPYVTHRHPEFWSRPETFDPERFASESIEKIEPFSYLPFLIGRRACLGEHFALIEGVVALSMIVARYRFELATPLPIRTKPVNTLRLAKPLMMRIRPRSIAP